MSEAGDNATETAVTENTIKYLSTAVTIISVVVGVIISVMNYKAAIDKDSQTRKMEAARPFLELRQKLYIETLNSASVLVSQPYHDSTEIIKAKKRFLELYWGELSLVENTKIDNLMLRLGVKLNLVQSRDTIIDSLSAESLTIHLAHTMRESIKQSWGIDSGYIGEVYK